MTGRGDIQSKSLKSCYSVWFVKVFGNVFPEKENVKLYLVLESKFSYCQCFLESLIYYLSIVLQSEMLDITIYYYW